MKALTRAFSHIVGPAAVAAAGSMGTGTTAALMLAGSWFNHALLWVPLLTLPLLITVAHSAAAVARSSNYKGTLFLIRRQLGPAVTWIVLVFMLAGHFVVSVGQLSVVTTSAGFLFGLPDETSTDAALAVAFGLVMLWMMIGQGYQGIQKVLTVLILCMLACVFVVALDGLGAWRSILGGLVPQLPEPLPVPSLGITREPMLPVFAIFGGALAPTLILGYGYMVNQDASTAPDAHSAVRLRPLILNLGVIFGAYCVLLLIAGAAALHTLPDFAEIDDVHEAAAVLHDVFPAPLSFLGPKLFAVGLLIAGVTTSVVLAEISACMLLDTVGKSWKHTKENRLFRLLLGMWIVLVVVATPVGTFPALLKVILAMGANAVIAPFAIIVLMLLMKALGNEGAPDGKFHPARYGLLALTVLLLWVVSAFWLPTVME